MCIARFCHILLKCGDAAPVSQLAGVGLCWHTTALIQQDVVIGIMREALSGLDCQHEGWHRSVSSAQGMPDAKPPVE